MQTHLKLCQRELRKNMPAPEKILWRQIRQKQLGVRFRRQYTTGKRILDFYAPQIRLGIEVDGHSHFPNELARQREIDNDKQLLKSKHIKVLRFLNTEVTKNLTGVLMKINQEIKPSPILTFPLPFRKGEGNKKSPWCSLKSTDGYNQSSILSVIF